MRDEWTETTLGDLVTLVKGISYRSSELSESAGRPFLNLKNVQRNGGYRRDGLKRYLGEGKPEQRANPGDVLVALTDLTRDMAVVGSPVVVPDAPELVDSWFSLDLARIVPKEPGRVLLPFLRLVLEDTPARDFMKRVTSGTTVMHLNTKAALGMPLAVPPIQEQRRIVDLISSIDDAIQQAHSYGSAADTAAVSLREQHFGNPDNRVKITDLADVTMGRQRAPKYAEGDHLIPYLRAANVKDGRLVLEDILQMNFDLKEQAKYRLEPGDTLVTEGCGSIDEIGASAQWAGELPGTVAFQNTLLRVRAKDGEAHPDYIHHWARYCYESGEFARIASGTNIFHIGSTRAKEMTIRALPMSTQQEVAGVLNGLHEAATTSRKLGQRLRDLRHTTLHGLVNGVQEIPDSYDRVIEEAS